MLFLGRVMDECMGCVWVEGWYRASLVEQS